MPSCGLSSPPPPFHGATSLTVRQHPHLNLKLSHQSRWHHVRDRPKQSVSAPRDNSDAIRASRRCSSQRLLVTGAALIHGTITTSRSSVSSGCAA
ncbi:hypothetical protein V8C43DRAFT_294038 [Trichoderma afarasin]